MNNTPPSNAGVIANTPITDNETGQLRDKTSATHSQSPPPRRSPGTSGLDGVAGLGSPDNIPFRPDAPEPHGFHDGLSLSDPDNDLFVVTDQPGTDLAQRGLCAAEVKVKSRTSKSHVEVKPRLLSRAAPKRPHEVAPFLSIDTVASKQNGADIIKVHYSAKSNRNSARQRINTPSGHSSSRMSLGDWNPLVPKPNRKYKAPPTANTVTRTPFKHSVDNPSNEQIKKGKRAVSPGGALKELMSKATYQMAQNIARQQPEEKAAPTGKLLKGRLRPLNVVNKQGPDINQCRGIVPDHYEPVPGTSKTYQRRKQVYSDHMLKGIPDPYDRPQTGESVHRPSIASDITDAAALDADLAELENIRKEKEEIASFMRAQGYSQDDLDEFRNNVDADRTPSPLLPVQDDIPVPIHGFIDGIPIGRPKTSDAMSRKSVRFDETSNISHASQPIRVTSSSQGKRSCKPFQEEGVRQKDDDNDEDRKDDKENRVVLQRSGNNSRQSSASQSRQQSLINNSNVNNSKPSSAHNHDTNHGGHTNATPLTSVLVNDFATLSDCQSLQGSMSGASVSGEIAGDSSSRESSQALVPYNNPKEKIGKNQAHLTSYKSADKVYERRARRPQSAKIVRQKIKANGVRRPVSAKAKFTCVLANEKTDLPKHPTYQRSAGTRPLSSRGHRPMVGLQLTHTAPLSNRADLVTDVKVDLVRDGTKKQVKLWGTTLIGSSKQEISRPDINYGTIKKQNYAHVKSTIPKQNLKKVTRRNYQKQITYPEPNQNCSDGFVDGKDSVDKPLEQKSSTQGKAIEANTFLTQMCDEGKGGKEEKKDTSSDDQLGLEVKGRAAIKEEFILNLESLEGCLENVQNEIHKCLDKVVSERENYPKDITDSTRNSAALTGNNTSSTPLKTDENYSEELLEAGLIPGEISSSLTRGSTETYRMKVYQYDSEAGERRLEEQLYSSDIIKDDIVGRTNSIDKDIDEVILPAEHKDENDLITNYDVTFMQQENGLDGGNNDETSNCPLEVQATAAVLNRARHEKDKPSIESILTPACFKINARPPEGFLYYFAYGLDMNTNRMSVYLGRDMSERLWGLLFGLRLIFNKKGLDLEAGLFPNLEFNPYSSVEGCLYLITPQELETLDQRMGYPEHYEHVVLPVWLLNCADPESFGVAQYCVAALMYVAQDSWVETGDLDPVLAENNMKQCAMNSDLLSSQYRGHIIDSMP